MDHYQGYPNNPQEQYAYPNAFAYQMPPGFQPDQSMQQPQASTSQHPHQYMQQQQQQQQQPQQQQVKQGPRYPNPNVQGNPHVYMAVYSSVPVYEMMVRGIGVMRRRSDSYMNATQLLKVAGVDKGRRTKVLERDIIQTGVHEKVQGGYGRYQGTWIPFQRATALADQYGISHLLRPLLDYCPPPSSMPGDSSSALAPSPVVFGETSAVPAGQRTTGDKRKADSSMTPDGTIRKRDGDDDLLVPDGKRARLGLSNGEASEPKHQLRPATKASKPVGSINEDPSLNERHRQILMSIFAETQQLPADLSTIVPADLDPDTPIDDHLHAALHWASALSRLQLIKSLVALGADVHRGNHAGETPLIRAVLATNNSDTNTFHALLEELAPSLRTVDESARSVLHHIALIAGVKGRAASARYYMETIFEHIARKEEGEFQLLVDAQDVNGDTALNIAARVGSIPLVRMLVGVGADKTKMNKLGLRAGDFGLDAENLSMSATDHAMNGLRSSGSGSTKPNSQELIANLTSTITNLGADFTAELKGKADALERTQENHRTATRELAEQRKAIAHWRQQNSKAEEQKRRINSLQRAIASESSFDWTGRLELDGRPCGNPTFAYNGPESILQASDPSPSGSSEIQIPAGNSAEDLIRLRRLWTWHARAVDLLRQRMHKVKGSSSELETRYRRIVAQCCGMPVDRVDGMLEQLLIAVESDGENVDLGRINSFMNKVKE